MALIVPVAELTKHIDEFSDIIAGIKRSVETHFKEYPLGNNNSP